MRVRTSLIAALAAVGGLGGPVASAAEPPQAPANASVASDAANMAVLDRFYGAVAATNLNRLTNSGASGRVSAAAATAGKPPTGNALRARLAAVFRALAASA